MNDVERAGIRRGVAMLSYGVAAVTLGIALTVSPVSVSAVAWAEPAGAEPSSPESGEDKKAGEDKKGDDQKAESTRSDTGRTDPEPDVKTDPESVVGGGAHTGGTGGRAGAAGPAPAPVSDPAPVPEPAPEPEPLSDPTLEEQAPLEPLIPVPVVVEQRPAVLDNEAELQPRGAQPIADLSMVRDRRTAREETLPLSTHPSAEALTASLDVPQDTAQRATTDPIDVDVSAASIDVDPTAPLPPQPLSPIAKLFQLPGQIVNAVLQLFDLSTSANSPNLPFDIFSPINNLVFGAFREFERLLGLHRTPAVQPVVATMTYDGPISALTPTVAQFLNASAAGYVLGGTPDGLVPFTVDGFQMSSTNTFSGMVGKAWVTPEGQIIIAYQGTTGGSHLLFNPLITIAQVIADLQVVFTRTTPLAFYDAHEFANRVQAEAALQGYTSDDIFVTGHSLGGWEAQYVAQQTGLAGIGFEAPGMNTTVPGNGADSMFVNIGTYGSSAPYMSTDLPGLQPFMPPYEPGGGSKPHYGPIVMIGDPDAVTPLLNASQLWGKGLVGSAVFLVSYLGNFFQYHLPGVQAYHLDVTPDPGIVTWLGTSRGIVHDGYGDLTITQLLAAASNDGILIRP